MSLVSAYPCLAPSARLDKMRLAGPDDLPRVSRAPAWSASPRADAAAWSVTPAADPAAWSVTPAADPAAWSGAASPAGVMTGILYRLTIHRRDLINSRAPPLWLEQGLWRIAVDRLRHQVGQVRGDEAACERITQPPEAGVDHEVRHDGAEVGAEEESARRPRVMQVRGPVQRGAADQRDVG